MRRLFNPINWMRLASPYFNRIDLAAEYYDEHLFEGRTFAALAHLPRRPFVIINATNMVNGERFEFTQEQFDFLASDLSSYPVAAASAFPFLLNPITLKNYPHTDFRPPKDYQAGLQDYDDNRRRYYWAKNRMIYLNDEQYPYLHFMDGGLSDNIGLRPIEAAYRRTSGFIRQLINDGKIEKFVIIVVNARTIEKDTLSRSERPSGILTVAAKTATIAMENYSVGTIETMKELQIERRTAQQNLAACQQRLDQCPAAPPLPSFVTEITPFVIEVNFEALRDPAQRDYFQSLPTSFALNREQVDALIEVGAQLLEESHDYRDFMGHLRTP